MCRLGREDHADERKPSVRGDGVGPDELFANGGAATGHQEMSLRRLERMYIPATVRPPVQQRCSGQIGELSHTLLGAGERR